MVRTCRKKGTIDLPEAIGPILCRRGNQLVAASSIKTQSFRIPTLSTIRLLEPLNCRKCKLELKLCRKCNSEKKWQVSIVETGVRHILYVTTPVSFASTQDRFVCDNVSLSYQVLLRFCAEGSGSSFLCAQNQFIERVAATKFSYASTALFDSTIKHDVSLFENLNRVVQDGPGSTAIA
jgi:hypothetical protein